MIHVHIPIDGSSDGALGHVYELTGRDHVKFWCQLYKEEDYKELALLALKLLVISPTSVICEQRFSVMHYVKNEFRSVLMQENLNACIAVAMTEDTVKTFPFMSLLKK